MSDPQPFLLQRAMLHVKSGYRIVWSSETMIQLTRPRPALWWFPSMLFGLVGPPAGAVLAMLIPALGLFAVAVSAWLFTLTILAWLACGEQSLLIYFDEAGEPRAIQS